MKKFLIVVILLAAVAAGGYYYVTNSLESSLEAVDPGDDTRFTIEILEGSSTDAIAGILADNGLISNAAAFKYHARKIEADGLFKAGTYVLSKSMTADEIMSELMKGGKSGNTMNITIIEGLTIQETAKTLAEQMGLDYDKLLSLMENGEQYKELYPFMQGIDSVGSLQGYLLPETYNVYINSSEEGIVKMLLAEFESFYESNIQTALPTSGMSLEEVVNLASIVEKEAVLDEERDDVAATFINRLNIEMPLQSCATVNYVLGEWKTHLTLDDIAVDSPYNTYINSGLPPTPINSPGKQSILAVLNPADVDYLYFVAKGDGSHAFSVTYEDHLAAKNKYQE